MGLLAPCGARRPRSGRSRFSINFAGKFRSELYQLWDRQTFLEDRLVFRIGKLVPTYDFNNVARPVATHDKELDIPAVTGLLYTPIFVNPTLLGAIGGYYNSVSGVTVSIAPTKNTYLRYGFYSKV